MVMTQKHAKINVKGQLVQKTELKKQTGVGTKREVGLRDH